MTYEIIFPWDIEVISLLGVAKVTLYMFDPDITSSLVKEGWWW